MAMLRGRKEVLELHRLYSQPGESLWSVAARIETSHETLRQLFFREGLPVKSKAQQASEIRVAREQLVGQHESEIIDLYKRHGTIDLVMEQLSVELPRKLVTQVINQIPDREAYRRRSNQPLYDRPELIRDLQRAAEHSGEPLSIPGYRTAARELGLASYDTQIRHWSLDNPDDPWLYALRQAGVRGNPARGKRETSIRPEDCVRDVALCIQANGGEPITYAAYCAWAKTRGAISGPSVRKLMGWNPAVEEALDSLSGSVR